MIYRFLHISENTLGIRITGRPREPVQPFINLFEVLREDGVLF